MNVGILYDKTTNMISNFFNNVISITDKKVEFEGGSAGGFNREVLDLIVVENPNFEVKIYGVLPSDLVDISDRFIKKTLEQENEELKQQIADLWQVMLMEGK